MQNKIPKKWTKEDKEFLKSFYLILSDEEIGKILGRGLKTIDTIRRRMGLSKRDKNIDYKKLYKQTPIVIIKDKKYYDKDKLKLVELVS